MANSSISSGDDAANRKPKTQSANALSVRSALVKLAVAAIVCSAIATGCIERERERVKSELANELQSGMRLDDIRSILVTHHLRSSGDIYQASSWSDLSGKVPRDTPVLVAALYDDRGEATLTVYVILNDDHTFGELIFDDVDQVL